MLNIQNKLQAVNPDKLVNHTQKAAYRLLSANGKWLSRAELARTIKSATSRIRDLRTDKFGGFRVDCKRADELNKRGNSNRYFYRINPRTVRAAQIEKVFGLMDQNIPSDDFWNCFYSDLLA